MHVGIVHAQFTSCFILQTDCESHVQNFIIFRENSIFLLATVIYMPLKILYPGQKRIINGFLRFKVS
jgi:hypothetical protein